MLTFVSADAEPWSSLHRTIVRVLHSNGIVPKHHASLPHRKNLEVIDAVLDPLYDIHCRGAYATIFSSIFCFHDRMLSLCNLET